MALENNGNNGYYYPNARPVTAQAVPVQAVPVQAVPAQAVPVYAQPAPEGNVYVAQPVRSSVQYSNTGPAQVIYSGAQYVTPNYSSPNTINQGPVYGGNTYGNVNQMQRDLRYDERQYYEQRRRQDLADEWCCIAGLTAGCCLCLALD